MKTFGTLNDFSLFITPTKLHEKELKSNCPNTKINPKITKIYDFLPKSRATRTKV